MTPQGIGGHKILLLGTHGGQGGWVPLDDLKMSFQHGFCVKSEVCKGVVMIWGNHFQNSPKRGGALAVQEGGPGLDSASC